ncbi:MAG: methyl-accepting chemotaxis protein [Chloroflexota bacterium]|nr:MAG: methyl-accepting chemotaxis protein [Chloroflexota bacterium]
MLKELTIRAKLIAAFIVVAVIAAFIGYMSWSTLRAAEADYNEVANVRLPSIVALNSISEALTAISGAERNLLIQDLTAVQLNDLIDQSTAKWEKADKEWKTYETLPQTEEEAVISSQFVPAWNQWKKDNQTVIDLIKKGASDSLIQAKALSYGQADVSHKKVAALLDQLVQINRQVAEDTTKSTQARMTGSTITLVVAIAIGGLLSLVFGIVLSMTIARGISRVIVVAEQIAQGDLTKRITIRSHDEMGRLAFSFNRLADSLHETIEQIADSSERIASASEELSATTEQFSSGADSQLSQSQQVASAMHEMSASILEVAKNAQEAANAAQKAAATANSGSRIVGETIDGIKRIATTVDETAEKVATLGQSSSQIGEIIGVIDDIADQTNLLALNAAIEAARAGEQGRGFAVVADEVRKLAERTSKATKEIATMITSIQRETQQAVQAMEGGRMLTVKGVEMGSEAEAALGQIVQMADRVGGMVAQIATAAEEQSSATEQINASVENITSVIEQTGDGARQSAKATEELAQLALDQRNLVGKFKLRTGTSAPHLRMIEPKRKDMPTLKGAAV